MSRTNPVAPKPKDPGDVVAADDPTVLADSGRREGEASPVATPRPENADAGSEPEPRGKADAGSESAPRGEVDESDQEALTRQLEAALADAQAQRDALLRAQAEMDNLRKRSAREVENARKYGVERLVVELLPVKDSLELGLDAARLDGVDVASLRDGIELMLKLLESALQKFDVAEVDPADAAFDPEFHQAMSTQEVEGVAAGTVVKVVQKGYVLGGRLVRPAMVIVAK